MQSNHSILTDIEGLERAFADAPKNGQERPGLLRRLAEAYVELENALLRDKIELSIKADELRKRDPAQATELDAQAQKADKILSFARSSAIKYYTRLKDEYPKWCQKTDPRDPSKNAGCTDEVLYYLAYEYEQGNRQDEARRTYQELIELFPNSKFIPNAYLFFAERAFEEATRDPSKLGIAEQAYLKATMFPPPENRAFGYAHYKLAFIYWTKGDMPRALSGFKTTIEYGMRNPSLPDAAKLAKAARKDILAVYVQSGGDPGKAFEFLRPISGDIDKSTEKTTAMMGELANQYIDVGSYPAGIAVYLDLIRRTAGAPPCAYIIQIEDALKRRTAAALSPKPVLSAADEATFRRAAASCAP